MDKLNIEAERREFEAWFEKEYPIIDGRRPKYQAGTVRGLMFASWQEGRRAAPSSSADELPPLPKAHEFVVRGIPRYVFTADQMQDYARAAIQAAAPPDAPKCGGTGCHDLSCLSCGGSGERAPAEDAREQQPGERALFDAAYLAEFGPADTDKLTWAWNMSVGKIWRAARRATGSDRAQAGEAQAGAEEEGK